METQLPDFVLADLYKNNIVIITEKNNKSSKEFPAKDNEIKTSETATGSKPEKFWLGDNKKNVSIVVRDAGNVFIDENELQFLSNILQACKLNLSDVAIVNLHSGNVSFNDLKTTLSAKYILLFGTEESEIGLGTKINLFQTESIEGIKIIKSPALKKLIQLTDDAKKQKAALWGGLKKIFGL